MAKYWHVNYQQVPEPLRWCNLTAVGMKVSCPSYTHIKELTVLACNPLYLIRWKFRIFFRIPALSLQVLYWPLCEDLQGQTGDYIYLQPFCLVRYVMLQYHRSVFNISVGAQADLKYSTWGVAQWVWQHDQCDIMWIKCLNWVGELICGRKTFIAWAKWHVSKVTSFREGCRIVSCPGTLPVPYCHSIIVRSVASCFV